MSKKRTVIGSITFEQKDEETLWEAGKRMEQEANEIPGLEIEIDLPLPTPDSDNIATKT